MSGSEPRQYRVLEVVGRGGFGTVYRAELTLPGGFVKDVALKVLVPAAEADPDHLARLRDEARMLALVRHRALVGVDGLVRLLDRWTVVMEYVPGASLHRLLEHEGRLPVLVALQIVEEVASGLHAAWTATDRDGRPIKLLHRDVKPSNVQITAHGEVKLLDFGIARGEFAARESSGGTLVYGSLPYLAPERLDLEDVHESDVYSLVVTLVQLVSGDKPLPASVDPVRQAEVVDQACALVAAAPGDPDLLRDLAVLVRKGLDRDPAARPDARELERACRVLRASRPDLHLADWAAEHVPVAIGHHALETGPYSGRVVSEEVERPRHLSELVGVAIPTTFDDPVTTEAETTFEVPAPETMPLPRPVPPPAVRPRRRWLWTALVAVLLTGVIGAVGLVAFTAGSSAILGALVVAIAADGEGSCVSTVRSTHETLTGRGTIGMVEAEPLFDAATQQCRDGRLGFWGSVLLMSSARQMAEDGVLADAEIRELQRDLVDLTGG